MKAEELKQVGWNADKLYDVLVNGRISRSYFRQEIRNEAEQYANQRVIEELEDIKIRLSKKSFSEHCVEEVDNRIKELKQ
tara:strand:- start:14179 stop:14418 length:240 start_codon:yes stop_codon:yes gene_type:complete